MLPMGLPHAMRDDENVRYILLGLEISSNQVNNYPVQRVSHTPRRDALCESM